MRSYLLKCKDDFFYSIHLTPAAFCLRDFDIREASLCKYAEGRRGRKKLITTDEDDEITSAQKSAYSSSLMKFNVIKGR